jgi:hypothetical protein
MRIITTADECAGLDWEIPGIDFIGDDDDKVTAYGQTWEERRDRDYRLVVRIFEYHNDVDLQGDAYDYFYSAIPDYYHTDI